MRSRATPRFWQLFSKLPEDIQRLALKNYALWRDNPSHPSLHFRPVRGQEDLFSVRIGDHYRALGRRDSGTIIWVWIGTHAEYNRLVGVYFRGGLVRGSGKAPTGEPHRCFWAATIHYS